MVAVFQDQGQRTAQRVAAAHAGHDSSAIGLDLLAAAPPVAALAARQVTPQVFGGELEAGGKSLDEHRELGTVRLSRGQPAQHSFRS